MKHAGIVHLQLGKNGITKSVLHEIREKILHTDPVVIKMNQSFTHMHDRKEAADTIAQETNTNIQSLVGGVLILTRKH